MRHVQSTKQSLTKQCLAALKFSDKNGQIQVSPEDWKKYDPQALLRHLSTLIVQGTIKFPYKRYFYTIPELRDNLTKFKELPFLCEHKAFKPCNTVLKTNVIDCMYKGPWPQECTLNCTSVSSAGETKEVGDLQYLSIGTKAGWYNTYHTIADYFVEPIRLSARRLDTALTPLQYFKTVRGSMECLKTSLKKYGPEINTRTLREAMYPQIKECETFKVSLAYLIYTKVFRATSVLDFCAGWGDRLVAAIAAGIQYTGIDVNPKLKECYQNIIQNLVPEEHKRRYTMYTNDWLEQKMPGAGSANSEAPVTSVAGTKETPCASTGTEVYNLIFTCPPYFNLELYDEFSTNQSTSRFRDCQTWTRFWLCESLRKAWSHLQTGGHMVIVLNDFSHKQKTKEHYCEAMVLWCIAFLKNCQFNGIMSYTNRDERPEEERVAVHQPIWVFEKVQSVPGPCAKKRNYALKMLQLHYSYMIVA